MAAHMIFIREKMRDEEEYEIYKQTVGEAMQGHAFIPHVLYGKFEVLEGADAQGVVLLEFESMAKAKSFYNSPAYHEACKHRYLGCDYRVILAEGLDSPAA